MFATVVIGTLRSKQLISSVFSGGGDKKTNNRAQYR